MRVSCSTDQPDANRVIDHSPNSNDRDPYLFIYLNLSHAKEKTMNAYDIVKADHERQIFKLICDFESYSHNLC